MESVVVNVDLESVALNAGVNFPQPNGSDHAYSSRVGSGIQVLETAVELSDGQLMENVVVENITEVPIEIPATDVSKKQYKVCLLVERRYVCWGGGLA
jgi:hypothetical protein